MKGSGDPQAVISVRPRSETEAWPLLRVRPLPCHTAPLRPEQATFSGKAPYEESSQCERDKRGEVKPASVREPAVLS